MLLVDMAAAAEETPRTAPPTTTLPTGMEEQGKETKNRASSQEEEEEEEGEPSGDRVAIWEEGITKWSPCLAPVAAASAVLKVMADHKAPFPKPDPD